MTNTGEIIRACREQLKLSRYDLEDVTGISHSTIFAVENKSDCKFSTFEKLLEGMGYEIEIMRKETERCR